MSSLKIVFVLPFAFDPHVGGVQNVTYQLGHYLEASGCRVRYVSLSASGHMVSDKVDLVFPERDCRFSGHDIRLFLTMVLGDFRPDVVINQTGFLQEPAASLWMLRKTLGFKVVSCFHNNPNQIKDNYKHVIRHRLADYPHVFRLIDHRVGWAGFLAYHWVKTSILFRLALARSDRFVLLSPTFFKELAWYIPRIDTTRLAAIPNGFRIPVMEPREKRKRLLFVGRLSHGQKNVLLLPRLWALISNALLDWELHIVGDGPDRGRLEQAIDERGLSRVFLHGKMDPVEHYQQAAIFLMLSAYEGFGNTLIEAQMHGVVPVAFKSYSALPWMLNDGVDAVFVEPFDLEHYAQLVTRLATDSQALARMRKASYENAKRFSEQRVGEQWIELFSELCGSKTAC